QAWKDKERLPALHPPHASEGKLPQTSGAHAARRYRHARNRPVPCAPKSPVDTLNRLRGTVSPPHSAVTTRTGAPVLRESDMTNHVSLNAARAPREPDETARQ